MTTTQNIESETVGTSSREASPPFRVYGAAWVRLAMCSLPRMLLAWVRTVSSAMMNFSAISRLQTDDNAAIRTRVRKALDALTLPGGSIPKGWIKSDHLQDLDAN